MISSLINRKVIITVRPSISEDQQISPPILTIPNEIVNLNDDYENLKKIFTHKIRRSKEWPVPVVQKIMVKDGSQTVDLNAFLEDVKAGNPAVSLPHHHEAFRISVLVSNAEEMQRYIIASKSVNQSKQIKLKSRSGEDELENEPASNTSDTFRSPSPSPMKARLPSANRRRMTPSKAVPIASITSPIPAAPRIVHCRTSPQEQSKHAFDDNTPTMSSLNGIDPCVPLHICGTSLLSEAATSLTESFTDDCSEDMSVCSVSTIGSSASRYHTNALPGTPGHAKTPGKIGLVSSSPRSAKLSRKPPVPKFGARAATPSDADATPLFGEGRTAGEVSNAFNLSFRSYDDPSRKTTQSKTPNTGSKKSKQASEESGSLSPLFHRQGNVDSEGRPSLGTMTMQWEFLRANFLKGESDELEWLMVSKKAGAYKYANKKFSAAEDKYYKSLSEIDTAERKIEILSVNGKDLMAQISIAASVSGVMLSSCEASLEKVRLVQAAVKELLSCKLNHAGDLQLSSCYSANTRKMLKLLQDEADKVKFARLCSSFGKVLESENTEIRDRLRSLRQDSEQALKDIEKWTQREKDTIDYAQSMCELEQAWFVQEEVKNITALRTMRSFIPIEISCMTSDELQASAQTQSGLFTMELAVELKKNKCLHWIVTHKDDIAHANFLAGDMKQYFDNVELYDVTELRAIAVCLPERFELDGDGKKAEWRARLMARVQLLASQENGESVQGGWDASLNKRALVQLPPLKPELARRSVYFFRTRKQADARLKQFDGKVELLAKKRVQLADAEAAAVEAKKEYDIILAEMRDPELKKLYGAEQFASVKELAKADWSKADKKAKTLAADVTRLVKTIDESPVSREQFVTSIDELRAFLDSRGIDWDFEEKPIGIQGVFDTDPVIQKTEKTAAKCLSSEEEAELRRLELNAMKTSCAKNGNELVQDSPVVPDPSVMSVTDASIGAYAACTADTHAVMDSSSLAPATAKASEKQSENSSDVLLTPQRGRGNILASANADLVNCLNKMFSPSSAPAVGGARLFSPQAKAQQSQGNPAVMASAADPPTEPRVLKTTKSRLLQSALNLSFASGSTGTEEAKQKQPPPPLSFMDQIKARKTGATEDSCVPPISRGASAAPISFLDAIKARKKD